MFCLKKLEVQQKITNMSLISSRKIQDVFSHYLLSSTSEDFPNPLPCEVISSLAGYFSFNCSNRFLNQPTWTQGDGATPTIPTVRWEAKDKTHPHSPDATIASDDHNQLDTSAGNWHETETFGTEKLGRTGPQPDQGTIEDPQVVMEPYVSLHQLTPQWPPQSRMQSKPASSYWEETEDTIDIGQFRSMHQILKLQNINQANFNLTLSVHSF